MMVTLNSRINISKKDSESSDYSKSSNSEIRARVPISSQGDNTETQEQYTTLAAGDAHNLNVSMAIQSSSHSYWSGG